MQNKANAPERRAAVLVSTYQRPWNLQRCLESVAAQTAINSIELIITDDGSHDETHDLISRFAQRGICPTRLVTQPHDGFRLARVRNNGVAVTTAPYLVFLDGDCVMPPDHVECHLRLRAKGQALVSDHARLPEQPTKNITTQMARQANFWKYVDHVERRRLFKKKYKDIFYSWWQISMRPRMVGCIFSLWRQDFERVNGFDENFIGWGLEDVDMQRRLELLGVRFKTILYRTFVYHLWHPYDPTFRRNASGTANRDYFERGITSPECQLGLQRTERGDFSIVPLTDEDRASSAFRLPASA